MFKFVSRVAARPAAAATTAAVAANAVQGPAHARAPPVQTAERPVVPLHANKIIDRDTEGWVLAEMQEQVLVFQPFDAHDIDDAASTVMALWTGRHHATAIVTEPDDDSSSTGTADDGLADAVMEAAAAASAQEIRMRQEREELESLLTITTRMLRRPGMQREVFQCMLEDREVRDLMLGHCSDLDRYLMAAGIPNPQLLPAPEAAAPADDAAADGPRGPPLLARVAGVVAGAMEKAGNALAALGSWLRRHVNGMFGGEEAEVLEEIGGDGSSSSSRPKRAAHQVLGSVMMLVVVVVCVMIIRRPGVLRVVRRA